MTTYEVSERLGVKLTLRFATATPGRVTCTATPTASTTRSVHQLAGTFVSQIASAGRRGSCGITTLPTPPIACPKPLFQPFP